MARAKKVVAGSIGAALAGKSLPWQFVTESDVTTVSAAVNSAREALKVAVNRTLDGVRATLAKKSVTVADALKGAAKSEPTGLRAELGRFAGACFTRDAGYSQSTPRNYASSMIAALQTNQSWEPNLANRLSAEKKAAAEKSGKGSSKGKSAGTVSRTSWESAGKTADKLVEQLALLQATKARQDSASKLAAWIKTQAFAK